MLTTNKKTKEMDHKNQLCGQAVFIQSNIQSNKTKHPLTKK
jgi:hypothetical protein